VAEDLSALRLARFDRFGGSTPRPAVRRIFSAAKSASMRRQQVLPARRKATVSAE
jgi:hypothetical protein